MGDRHELNVALFELRQELRQGFERGGIRVADGQPGAGFLYFRAEAAELSQRVGNALGVIEEN